MGFNPKAWPGKDPGSHALATLAKPFDAGALPKGFQATLGQAPMGIAKNGNIAGALQSTQGQKSYLSGMTGGKSLLG